MEENNPPLEPGNSSAAPAVMDVVPPPSNSQSGEPTNPLESEDKPDKHHKEAEHSPRPKPEPEAKEFKQPTPKKPGTGLAVLASVVIVIALGALATYAYLKTR